jgi:hypothetical protein
MPAARPTAALIERALKAWTDSGLTVGSIEVAPDGTIRISAAAPKDAVASPQTGETAWDRKIARKARR